jgi:hypothetical protein
MKWAENFAWWKEYGMEKTLQERNPYIKELIDDFTEFTRS